MLSELEIIKKNGKKSGVLKKWEDTLCGILSQYDAFEGAVDCAIDVDYDHEFPGASAAVTDYVEEAPRRVELPGALIIRL